MKEYTDIVEYLRDWKAALESRKYEAYAGCLARNNNSSKMCCLGVLDAAIHKVDKDLDWSRGVIPSVRPAIYKKYFNSNLPAPIDKKLTEVLANYDEDFQSKFSADTLEFCLMGLNDTALNNDLPGAEQYKQVIEFIDAVIDYYIQISLPVPVN